MKTILNSNLFALLFSQFLCCCAYGQVVPAIKMAPAKIHPAMVDASQTLDNPVATPATQAPNAKPGPDSKETPEQKKVKLLLKEKFDRTPQAVLKAWSAKPETETQKKPKTKPITAVVKNAFEGFAVLEFDEKPTFKINDVVKIQQEKTDLGNWKLLSIDGKKVSAKLMEPSKLPTTPLDTQAQKIEDEQTSTNPKASANTNPSIQESNSVDESVETDEKESEKTASSSSEKMGADSNGTVKTSAELASGTKVVLIDIKTLNKQPDVDKQIENEVRAFAKNVVLGKWDQVKTFLGQLDENEADKVYAHLLKSLASAPRKNGQPTRGQQPMKPHLSPSDLLALSDASPKSIQIQIKSEEETNDSGTATNNSVQQLPANIVLPPGVSIDQLPPEALNEIAASGSPLPTSGNDTKPPNNSILNHVAALATLMRNSKSAGHDFTDFVNVLESGTRHFGGQDRIKRLTAADLFMKSGMTNFVEDFLPKLDVESTQTDLPALKIWSQLALARHSEKLVAEWLEKAWQINQWIVALEDVGKSDRDLALSNLVNLSSKIDKDVGVKWMNESFTAMPNRGMTILTNLGTKSADMALKAAQTPEKTRLDLLRLQNEAVEKLIGLSPKLASDWNNALTLLAANWLKEAETSLKYAAKNSGRSYMNIDMYGNYYWVNSNQRNQMYGNNNRRPRPIKVGDILEIAPSVDWQEFVDPTLHTNLRKTKANLYMRINEENKAFPYIEEIAQDHADVARELVHEFLRIWTQNHDPNSSKRQRNPYIYFYGFDRKAEAIPLTRSKQERNLEELSGWVDRIRKLPIEDIDQKLLAEAFTTCHSTAEVFKLDRFRSVFGELENLKPETVAAICEKMRANLASNWRDIRNQEQKQTNRREPEVQQAVLEGYDTGLQLCEESLSSSPDNWRLHLAKATLMFDQNAYAQSVQKSSEFSDRRDTAFDQFKTAADKYASVVPSLEQKDQSTDVYDFWFYASLGAVDLGKITDKTVPDLRQYAKIKAAIDELAPNISQWHMAKFANNLFTRMSPIKPEIKFRYLRGGFEIVGEHPRAWEAKNLFDYYKDLVSEIQLSVLIDGEDKIGSQQPFGAYVNVLHTKEIERESGGFGKYVQNQNSMMYAYNYGRPTENYRDKFTDSVELALGEHFEVLNVTFQAADTMKSRPATKEGWRITPYAYMLLKPKGPEVDRIAPLKLDLDFLDTSGYVVIPIESPALIVDCSIESAPMRPVTDLKITQTLDERQADDGKLIVEISATGKGLVPDLDQIIDLERDNFEVVSIDDQGVLPSSFDKDSEEIQILSDRSWTVEYRAKESDNQIVNFAFSDAKIDETSSKFQRYEDADLVEVSRNVELEKTYSAFSWLFLYWLIPLLIVGLFGLAGLIYIASQPKEVAKRRFEVPDDVNPFTVLTLLKDIKQRNGISNEQGTELQNSIDRIENHYFGDLQHSDPEDLEKLAQSWVRIAK